MSEEEDLPPQVEYWLSPDTKPDCYFNVGSESGSTERIGSFKAFLIGYSKPLRAMLQDSELAEQGDISIVDIEPDTFRDFLKCLYIGLTDSVVSNHTFKKCCDLLYVADKYLVTQLKGKLIDQCLKTLSSEISCINAACSSKVFMQEKCLKAAFSKIVQCQIESIISSEEFFQTNEDSLIWILELDPLDIDEISLWKAVLKWAKHKTNSNDGNVIRKCTLKLLKYIRFCSMNVQDFCKNVIPTKVLIGKEISQICEYFGNNVTPNMAFICNIATRRHHSDDFKLRDVTVFSYHVHAISSLTQKSRKSKLFTFQCYKWHLSVRKHESALELYLECDGSNDPNWECCVNATLTLVNHKGPNYSLTVSKQTFCSEEERWGFPAFLLWSEVMAPSNNYVLIDSILVLVALST